MKTVIGIVGSYRRSGVAVAAVDAVLEGARAAGAQTEIIHLIDQNLNFCTNCRRCTQKPGPERGRCLQLDGLEPLLQQIEDADAVVLGSAVNYGSVTAVFRKFMERLTGFYYWPWGQPLPKLRKPANRKAVLVASSGMPGFMLPLFTDVPRSLRLTAILIGTTPVSTIWAGRYAWQANCRLLPEDKKRAMEAGRKLAL